MKSFFCILLLSLSLRRRNMRNKPHNVFYIVVDFIYIIYLHIWYTMYSFLVIKLAKSLCVAIFWKRRFSLCCGGSGIWLTNFCLFRKICDAQLWTLFKTNEYMNNILLISEFKWYFNKILGGSVQLISSSSSSSSHHSTRK